MIQCVMPEISRLDAYSICTVGTLAFNSWTISSHTSFWTFLPFSLVMLGVAFLLQFVNTIHGSSMAYLLLIFRVVEKRNKESAMVLRR